MVWSANPWSTTFLVAAMLPLVLGAVVFSVRPGGLSNRRLALLLVFEGVLFLTAGATWLADTPRAAYGMRVVNQAIAWAWIIAYLPFLATIDSPLSRPLRSRYLPPAFLGLTLLAVGSVLIWPDAYLQDIHRNSIDAYDMTIGPANSLLVVFLVGILLYGLAVAYTAWRRTYPGTQERSRAWVYLAAFGLRDLLWLLSAFWYDTPPSRTDLTVQVVLQSASIILFTTLLAYGILRTQLFDIDLKIKWTINRGTLVGLFLAVFFVVTVTAENFLTDRYGWAVGGIGAGLLLFALTPLQRFAARVADRAMPHVKDTEEYRTVRKRDVYLAALEGALVDGSVSDRERDMLARLQDQLGLTATEARELERASAV